MTDLSIYALPHDLDTAVRVMFTVDAEERVHVYGVFRIADDVEIDYAAMTLDDREQVEERCRYEFQQYMKEQQ